MMRLCLAQLLSLLPGALLLPPSPDVLVPLAADGDSPLLLPLANSTAEAWEEAAFNSEQRVSAMNDAAAADASAEEESRYEADLQPETEKAMLGLEEKEKRANDMQEKRIALEGVTAAAMQQQQQLHGQLRSFEGQLQEARTQYQQQNQAAEQQIDVLKKSKRLLRDAQLKRAMPTPAPQEASIDPETMNGPRVTDDVLRAEATAPQQFADVELVKKYASECVKAATEQDRAERATNDLLRLRSKLASIKSETNATRMLVSESQANLEYRKSLLKEDIERIKSKQPPNDSCGCESVLKEKKLRALHATNQKKEERFVLDSLSQDMSAVMEGNANLLQLQQAAAEKEEDGCDC